MSNYVLEAKESLFGGGEEIAIFSDSILDVVQEFLAWLTPADRNPRKARRAKIFSLKTGELLCTLDVRRDGSLRGRAAERYEVWEYFN